MGYPKKHRGREKWAQKKERAREKETKENNQIVKK